MVDLCSSFFVNVYVRLGNLVAIRCYHDGLHGIVDIQIVGWVAATFFGGALLI